MAEKDNDNPPPPPEMINRSYQPLSDVSSMIFMEMIQWGYKLERKIIKKFIDCQLLYLSGAEIERPTGFIACLLLVTAGQTDVEEESQEEEGGQWRWGCQVHGLLELRSGRTITGCFIMTANFSLLLSVCCLGVMFILLNNE